MTVIGGVDKLATYVPGLDYVMDGGLPAGRVTLLSGTAGSAKTTLGVQFLVEGIRRDGKAGVFVTFEEQPAEIRSNMLGLGWELAGWESQKLLAFVDASPDPDHPAVVAGDFDLGALLARIESAILRLGAERVVLDSLGSVFARYPNPEIVRAELFRLVSRLKAMGVTSILTAERPQEEGPIARYEVEEFVTDNVVVLRNHLDEEHRRRTLEVVKFRGASHRKGEYPFSVIADQGVVVIPLSAIEMRHEATSHRISAGNAELDVMCGGGLFADSVVLVSGPTGTGKTLLATQFLAAGAQAGEKSLLFSFEESRRQLFRNADAWGIDLEGLERSGALRVVCAYPEADSLEDHLIRLKTEIDAVKPKRVVVDSLSALRRVAGERAYREFVVGLVSFVNQGAVTALFTATTSDLTGGSSVTDPHLYTITDTILLLHYVEMHGEMRRGLTVLKMRGSNHDKHIRELTISDRGLQLGKPFRELYGVLSASPRNANAEELADIRKRFPLE